MRNQELTDIGLGKGISMSQLSKLDMKRPYQIFVEIICFLNYPYIMFYSLLNIPKIAECNGC